MTSRVPMFTGWSRSTFGRAPLRTGTAMRRKSDGLSSLCTRQAEETFGALLPARLLAAPPGRRSRIFTTPVVFWTFLCQILGSESCRSATGAVQSLLSHLGKALCSSSDAAYCMARAKLPIRMLIAIQRHICAALCPRRGARTFVFDGSTISMPDTPENQARWPQSGAQQTGVGFPIMRIVGLFDLATGAWIAMARGTLAGSKRGSERILWRRLWKHLQAGDTVIADAGFCDWFSLVLLQQRGIRLVIRNNGRRKPCPNATRLGKGDWIERWRKPAIKPAWVTREDYDSLPQSIAVRVVTATAPQHSGFRTQKLELISTVTDPAEMGAEEIAGLYLRRWDVELFIDDLKTSLGMDILRTRSPHMIYRELLMHVIAYNLLRALIRQADDPRRISFKGSLDRVNKWLPVAMATTSRKTRKRLIEDLLETMAEDLVRERPNRREPRLKKRRPKPFGLMTRPRGESMEIPHRSKYRKSLT
ncbi:IS4 family transposase [Haloferula sp. A504]|uniref:IS4 family transposase n=1 Tax=Haloferula sp. A504 TaxID=3373601 RepID=UPI0031CA05C7|nr:IS4 family transposase [Verrucomicrobiaceae bacterium E54]